jgi:hypothetical protein
VVAPELVPDDDLPLLQAAVSATTAATATSAARRLLKLALT